MGRCKGKWNRRKEESVSVLTKRIALVPTESSADSCTLALSVEAIIRDHSVMEKTLKNNSQSMYIAHGQYDCCVTNVVIGMFNQ